MLNTEKACPLCNSVLQLKQINFEDAVFICAKLHCPYPVGSECIEVHSRLEDTYNIIREEEEAKKRFNSDLNEWLKDVYESVFNPKNNEDTASMESTSDSCLLNDNGVFSSTVCNLKTPEPDFCFTSSDNKSSATHSDQGAKNPNSLELDELIDILTL